MTKTTAPRTTTDTIPDASEAASQSTADTLTADTARDGVPEATRTPGKNETNEKKLAATLVIPPPPAALFAAMNAGQKPAPLATLAATVVLPAMIKPAPVAPLTSPASTTRDDEVDATLTTMADEHSIAPVAMTVEDTLPPPTNPRVRSMFDSMLMMEPSEDPVLTAKQAPAIAVRRARFQRYVKIAVGACSGMCVIALVCSLIASPSSAAHNASGKVEATHVVHAGKTTLETLEVTSHGRAPRAPFVSHSARVRASAHR